MRTLGRGANSVFVVCLLLNLSVVLLLYGLVHQSSDLDNPLDEIEDNENVDLDVNVNLEDDQVVEEDGIDISANCGQSMKFTDYPHFNDYVITSSQQNWTWIDTNFQQRLTAGGPEPDLDGASSPDYSPTNIQVQGVDEPDIVKTDGKYIYMISRNDLVILQAYPGEEARVLSRIHSDYHMAEMFISGSKLVLFENHKGTRVSIYDIESRMNPQLITTMSLSGGYYDSRRIGANVYVVAKQHALWHLNGEKYIVLPVVGKDNATRVVEASEICHFGESSPAYQFTMIGSIDLETNSLQVRVYLIDSSQTLYVSKNNIYIAHTDHARSLAEKMENRSEASIIHKISINEGEIRYAGSGYVPGRVLNQFSLDEHDGYLRIATTVGHVWRTGSDAMNNVYVLDDALRVVGKLEDLAPGERIYSARFIDDRCYLVTFKKVDPFFVIDLREPEFPKILGMLKITGYSNYLHPYDENHIIGLGKDTYDMGDFAWFQGVKLSLFDITNVSEPVEISKYVIGDRGTSSYVLYDHKAFMFSRSRSLLVIPISLYEVNDKDAHPKTRGEFVWQGAYVLSVTLDNGFELKGRITHVDDDAGPNNDWGFTSPNIRRSLYIEDTLYTISERMIKANSMDALEEITRIEL